VKGNGIEGVKINYLSFCEHGVTIVVNYVICVTVYYSYCCQKATNAGRTFPRASEFESLGEHFGLQ